MKPLRIVYLVVLIVSLGLAFGFYYHYQLKDKELTQYRNLSQVSNKAFEEISAKLAQSKRELEKELKKFRKEIEGLNKTIAILEKGELSSKGELQALKEEREILQTKIAGLIEERAAQERKFLSLKEKFHSFRELKKALRIAKIEQRKKDKIARDKRRLAKIEMLKRLDEAALRQGNRGYLLRQGGSTFKPKIRVELEPANKW